MRVSTRGEYGLRAVLDLAQHYGYGPIALKQIARRQEVSEHYLEQLMGGLRKAGLVASVRGARIVLADDDGVRANMTASWLAQMGWDVAVLDELDSSAFTEQGAWKTPLPPLPQPEEITPATLAGWLAEGDTQVLDFTASANYVKQHIPGAHWVLRAQLAQALENIPPAQRYVLTCGSSLLARFAVDELRELSGKPVFLLQGGTASWLAAGLPREEGPTRLAVPRTDRYQRPYEGTDNPKEAMQGYLDWEFGLVEQLGRDGTHGFRVI